MRSVIIGLFISLQLIFSIKTYAQNIISGRVFDATTKQPLSFASVYLNGSTRGTTADATGNYQLAGIPSGTVEVVVSSVGFKTVRQTIRLINQQNHKIDFSLLPDTQALQAITVTAKHDKNYDRLLKLFKRELLGNSPFAGKCLITNIEKVVLTLNDGRLEAQAIEPIVIDNKALGYRLYYNLTHFDTFRQTTHYAGTSRFELLKPDNDEQAERWERNRQKVYMGSSRHLLASLLAGTYEQEGFLVYEASFNVPTDPSIPVLQMSSQRPTVSVNVASLVKPAELASERQVVSVKPLEIFYTRRQGVSTPYRDLPYAYSILYLPKGNAIVTTDGWIAQSNGLEIRGAMSEDRLATLLPADWKPVNQRAILAIKEPDEGVVLPSDTLLKVLSKPQINPAPVVFLHIDKSFYTTGDHLWFSGYVLNPSTLQPISSSVSDKENPLHIELLAPGGRLIQHQWARVNEGRTWGRFRLSDSLATGVYELRAYTEQNAVIGRPAFERIVPIVNGMGGEHGLKQANSFLTKESVTEQLPPVLTNGLALSADIVTDSTQLVVRIQASSAQALDPVYLTMRGRGQLLYLAKLQLQNGKARLTIPVTKLAAGVAQVMLFNAQGLLQAERFVFIPERFLPPVITMTTDKASYRARESVLLSLRITDGTGEPLSIMGSVSVTDASQLPADTNVANIRTHLLLMSDLRGYVENANSYLNSNHINVRRKLDSLLLNKQWRRLAGLSEPDSIISRLGTGLLLRGLVLDKRNKAISDANVLLTFMNKTGTSFARSARTDQQGRFLLDDLMLTDTIKVRARIMNTSFKPIPMAHLAIDRPGYSFPLEDSVTSFDWNWIRPFIANAQERQAVDTNQYRDRDARQLQEVTVRSMKPDDDRWARKISLHNEADATILFDEKSMSYANVYDMMAGRVAGVLVKRRSASERGHMEGGYSVTVRGAGSFAKYNPPLYVVDGSYVIENEDGTALLMINPSQIERIEVIKNGGGAIYGARGGGGVIAFYSKNGEATKIAAQDDPEITFYGYPAQQQFYIPQYGTDSIQADRRDVLYWKPVLLTDSYGFATLRFPLSDIVRTIRITLQGITAYGRPIYVNRLITIR
ncbi:carboxypeptidase-like regulatory domain-containing protein [Spirosoma sp. SC4-14]|uniref:carboxypeptidase-like regulatory domain-containing protein n=1 Tax=Spirosoma sp. SC4-14 TaxID=3128900 RepID=UPI0030D5DAE7